jgi:DNA processing protein
VSDPSVRACDACLRRTWLIARLAGHLEVARHGGRAPGGRLREVLALDDEQLLAALAGGAQARIVAEWEAVDPRVLRRAVADAGLAGVCRHDARYPARLADLPDRPAVLHVAGGLAALDRLVGGGLDRGPRAVAIVGTRRGSPEGLEVARALGRGLAAAGVTVVSGMALGVDSAAHAGALEAGGPTLAVLGGGAERATPTRHRELHRVLTERHAVVSELPPGFRPHRWCFPARNRLIAALSSMTVVVEAAERSGSLITAEFAADLGREVGAVPGSPLAWRSAGANALLRDGAVVVRDAADVLDAVLSADDPRRCGGPRPSPVARFAGLEPRLRHLLEAVASGRDTTAALCSTPTDVDDVVSGLTELELLGALRRAPGGRYVVVPA